MQPLPPAQHPQPACCLHHLILGGHRAQGQQPHSLEQELQVGTTAMGLVIDDKGIIVGDGGGMAGQAAAAWRMYNILPSVPWSVSSWGSD